MSSSVRRSGDCDERCFRSKGKIGGDVMVLRSCGGDVILSKATSSFRAPDPGDRDSLLIVVDRFALVTSFSCVFDDGELRRGSRKREKIAHLVDDD